MPTRLLRDWTDSAKFEGITAEAERLFARLLMKADDFGRFHGDPRLIKSYCYPLAENVTAETIMPYLEELAARGLVFPYSARGKELLAVVNFRQRLRLRVSKFPAPQGMTADWQPDDSQMTVKCPSSDGQVTVTCQSNDGQVTVKCPPETHTETHSESETQTHTDSGHVSVSDNPAAKPAAPEQLPLREAHYPEAEIPTQAEVNEYGAMIGATPETCRQFFQYYDAKPGGWQGIIWKKKLLQWRDEHRAKASRPKRKGPNI